MKTFREFADQRNGITVTYRAVDGFRKTQRFNSLPEAQAFAQKWVGEAPELGTGYAVSGDGVGKVTAQGATLADLFPKAAWQDAPEQDYGSPSSWDDIPTARDAWAASAERDAEIRDFERLHSNQPAPKPQPQPQPGPDDLPF